MTTGHKSWGKLLGEAVLDVVLLVLDHLTLSLVWVPGFKPLFLLQVPVLILDFDFFPTFLSWVDICHTAQWFHLRWLSAYSILVIPRLFLLFVSPPPPPHLPTLNWKLFPFARCCFLQGLLWPVTLNFIHTCSWCYLPGPPSVEVGGPVLGSSPSVAVYMAIPIMKPLASHLMLLGLQFFR